MKKLVLTALSFMVLISFLSGQEEGDKGFKKENLFTGGSITVSFFNRQTLLGANPMFGYKLADWVDAGLAFNFLYSGMKDYIDFDDRLRQTVYGPGVFARLYPINFLFAQAQFEHNFTRVKYIPASGTASEKYKTSANSLLLGAGFAQGREKGSNSFYYISLLFDVLKDINSPYTNVDYNPTTGQPRLTMAPIIRAGLNIALFEGKYE